MNNKADQKVASSKAVVKSLSGITPKPFSQFTVE
jgi:hypothetical protein